VRGFVPDPQRALDVVQDVWLTVFRRLGTLRQTETFRAWLYQIAHDQVVRRVRSEIRDRKGEAAAREVAEREAPDPPLGAENAELVHRGLAALSVEHREVLTLRFLEDMRLDEIAHATRCNVGTVKSRLHYAKQAMRQEVERLSHE
jgi:RNA polymerase sigma-70 factor (ECF subfamily)